MQTKKIFLSQYPPSTQRVYGGALNEFESATGVSLEDADRDAALRYHEYIKDQSPATVARKLATMSSYFSYMVELEIRSDNPIRIIRRPHVDTVKQIKWLERSEVKELLDVASNDLRTLSLIWVGLHGLRVSEIVGLDADHLRGGSLRVTGKGNRTRYVALAEQARNVLETYLAGRTSGPMFLGGRGRLKVRRIQDIISEVSEQAGKRISPHALRHTIGTDAIRNGVPTLVVQKFLGHRNSRTTEIYVHLDDSDTKRMVDTTFAYLSEPFSVIEGGKEKDGGLRNGRSAKRG